MELGIHAPHASYWSTAVVRHAARAGLTGCCRDPWPTEPTTFPSGSSQETPAALLLERRGGREAGLSTVREAGGGPGPPLHQPTGPPALPLCWTSILRREATTHGHGLDTGTGGMDRGPMFFKGRYRTVNCPAQDQCFPKAEEDFLLEGVTSAALRPRLGTRTLVRPPEWGPSRCATQGCTQLERAHWAWHTLLTGLPGGSQTQASGPAPRSL